MTQIRICQRLKKKVKFIVAKSHSKELVGPLLLSRDVSALSEVIGASAKRQSWPVSVRV